MTRPTAETSFDDDEVMLIEKANGSLCRITKQQLPSFINTDTTYTEGANICINGSNVIKLNNDISTNSVEAKTDLTLRTLSTNNADYLNSIIFQNTGSFKTIALTRRYNNSMTGNTANFCIQNGTGGTLSDSNNPIRVCARSGGQVNIGSSQTKTHGFNVEGTSNFEDLITGTNINITGNYQISGVNIPTTDTQYLLGNNLSFDTNTTPHTINMDNDLTSGNSITSISTSDLTIGAGSSSQSGDKIILKTNDVQRGYINDIDLDLSVNVNIPNDKHYQIDGADVLHNISTTVDTNIHSNARIIQNVSSNVLGGLFINYLTTASTNAHVRFYSGGTTTIRMFIKSDGKIGINTLTPTELLDVNGSMNITTGNDYKINGTAIVHSCNNGTDITIDTNKNINLNSPLVGISGIQNKGDIVFTRNNV